MKQIFDACCGSRMFWFDKEHPATVFMDNRSFAKTLCDGRRFEVKPDLIADFREIPFPDESSSLSYSTRRICAVQERLRGSASSMVCSKVHGRMICAEDSRSVCASSIPMAC